MTINLKAPDITELKPRITVFGVGGAGGNAVNNMIEAGLTGVEFVVANTDAQALTMSKAERMVQMGVAVTEGLGAGSQPEVGRAAAEETIDEINDHLNGSHMAFITAGMGGGTGTGAAPVVARAAREQGILTVGVVTKPFHFEGQRRMTLADAGIVELQKHVDTLIVIPNQNLFRIANEKTTFSDAFGMADEVLYSGVACITDLMVKEGLINLDFADVRSVMRNMGKAMMGTGEASADNRAIQAAEAAIANPLLDDVSMRGARGLLISITGGNDLTLFEVDEAASRIREEVDADANIILGATFDDTLEGVIRVSVVATGIDLLDEKDRPSPMDKTLFQKPIEVANSSDSDEHSAQYASTVTRERSVTPMRSYSDPEVRIERVGAQGRVQDHQDDVLEERVSIQVDDSPQEPFIPQTAIQPEKVHRRMPSLDEFPKIARQQFSAHAGNVASSEQSDTERNAPEESSAQVPGSTQGFLGKLTRLRPVTEAETGVGDNERSVPQSNHGSNPVNEVKSDVDVQKMIEQPISSQHAVMEDQAMKSAEADQRAQASNAPASTPASTPAAAPASVLIDESDESDIPAFLRRGNG